MVGIRNSLHRFLVAFFFLFLSCQSLPAGTSDQLAVRYTLDATASGEGVLKISMTIENIRANSLTLSIPAWSPGAYWLRNYYKNIRNVAVTDSTGAKLAVDRIDPQTWTASSNGSTSVVVTYEREINKTTNYFLLEGPQTYMYVVDCKSTPASVKYLLPEGWKCATGLEKRGDSYYARDYDTFIDAPAALGKFEERTFYHNNVQYDVTIHGATDFDIEKFIESIKKIVAYQTELMEGAPFSRYLFIFNITDGRGGTGLEHLNSTSITFGGTPLKENPASHGIITAHEFFHLWNVKRVRPKELGPFDYTKEVRTNALWLCEGVTSYYTDLTLVRTGIWTEEQFYSRTAKQIEYLQANPDRLTTSAEMAGWRTWDKDRDGIQLSYYNKGQLLGMLFDLAIREKSGNERSFDDVMRFMLRWFVRNGTGAIGEGFDEGDILRAINSVSGHDFTDFYRRYVGGTVELPFKETLAYAGLDLTVEKRPVNALGVKYLRGRVCEVSPDNTSGIAIGDRILSVNGVDIHSSSDLIGMELAKCKIGDTVEIKVKREDEEKKFTVAVVEGANEYYTIKPIDSPTESQLRIRKAWLGQEFPESGKIKAKSEK